MNKRLLSIAFVLFTSCAAAQPFLFYRGVGNAASYIPSGLPGGQLARGSIFSLFGRAMGPAQGVQVNAFPLATTLAGVGVDVCQGGACTPAIPIYVRQDQINAILPSNAPLGDVSLRVTYNGIAGNFTSASVISRGVGLFTINSAGFGPAVAQNFVSSTDQPVNSADTPAKPGQTVVLWATGLGPGLNGDNLAPQVGDIASVDIWVGGKLVTTRRYQGRSGCCSGLDQIIFDLPGDTPTGCYVPIQIAVEGVVSNTATIAVSSDGSACADRFHPVSERFRGGGRLGLMSVNRSNILKNLGTSQPEVTAESVTATFRRVSGGAFSFTPEISLPPLGSCSAQTARGDLFGGDSLPGFAAPAAELDAGPQIRVAQQPAERDVLTRFYAAQLASSQTRLKLPVSALTPSFPVTGAGGSDIGSFQFSLAAAGTIAFENRAALEIVDRSKDLTVQWQGGSPDTDVILVMGVGVNLPGNSSIQFLCTADPAAGSFNIPSRMLQMFPRVTQTARATAAFSQISVGRVPLRTPQTFTAPGLDAGFALASQWSGRAVIIP